MLNLDLKDESFHMKNDSERKRCVASILKGIL